MIFQRKKDTDNIGKRAKVELKYGNPQFVLDFKVLSGRDFFLTQKPNLSHAMVSSFTFLEGLMACEPSLEKEILSKYSGSF